MLEDILSLSRELIKIKSDPGNMVELDHALELVLDNLGGYKIERFNKDGVSSALIYNKLKRPKKFKVILNGHLDVIPGKAYQYIPQIKNDRIYGVGALDMKANLVCLIMAFKEVAKQVGYPLGLQIVTDEEVGGFKGTKHQIEKGVNADFVIAGETTKLNIVNRTKGIIWLKISSKGKTAHGAYPWKGKNAIWDMHRFLAMLNTKYPVPTKKAWSTTINLSKIKTDNSSFNKVPDNCEVWLDIRYTPEDSGSVIPYILSILPPNFKLEIITEEAATFVDEKNEYLQKLKKSVKKISKKQPILYGAQGSSDARHYNKIGSSGVEFGAVGGGIGTDNEWISIPSLYTYYLIIKDFLLGLD